MSQFLIQISLLQDANFYATCPDTQLIKKLRRLYWWWWWWKGRRQPITFAFSPMEFFSLLLNAHCSSGIYILGPRLPEGKPFAESFVLGIPLRPTAVLHFLPESL